MILLSLKGHQWLSQLHTELHNWEPRSSQSSENLWQDSPFWSKIKIKTGDYFTKQKKHGLFLFNFLSTSWNIKLTMASNFYKLPIFFLSDGAFFCEYKRGISLYLDIIKVLEIMWHSGYFHPLSSTFSFCI